MEKYNCKKQIKGGIIFFTGVLVLLVICLIFFVKELTPYVKDVKERIEVLEKHPTYHAYEDEWIIGKTVEEIEERYGEVDIDDTYTIGYRIDVYQFWKFLSLDTHDYVYYIDLDENKIARYVYAAPDITPSYNDFLDTGSKLDRILFSLGLSFY